VSSVATPERYLPLRDYALIGDARTAGARGEKRLDRPARAAGLHAAELRPSHTGAHVLAHMAYGAIVGAFVAGAAR